MSDNVERRKHIRYLAENLTVEIGGKTHPVVNISTDGLQFKASGYFPGNPVSLIIRSIKNEAEFIKAECKVIEVRADCVHVEFAKPTMPLMHFVIGQIGQAMGVKPYYFKTGESRPNPGGA